MTKTAILIFFLGIIFGSLTTFYLSLRFFSHFGFQNLVLPSVENIVVFSGENQKIKDQILSEFKKQKSDIESKIYDQLKNNIKTNFKAYIFGQ